MTMVNFSSGKTGGSRHHFKSSDTAETKRASWTFSGHDALLKTR